MNGLPRSASHFLPSGKKRPVSVSGRGVTRSACGGRGAGDLSDGTPLCGGAGRPIDRPVTMRSRTPEPRSGGVERHQEASAVPMAASPREELPEVSAEVLLRLVCGSCLSH